MNTPYIPVPEMTALGLKESARLQTDKIGVCDLSNPVYFMLDLGIAPLQIADGGDQLVILNETIVQPRRIFLDGRDHPADPDPTWLGHSIGHWEGETLVVDTIGTNGLGRALNGLVTNGPGGRPAAGPRLPTSAALHLVERMRLLEAGGILEVETTVDDPTLYRRPFTFKKYFQRRPDITLVEYQCVED
jgi:hypothetical protein